MAISVSIFCVCMAVVSVTSAMSVTTVSPFLCQNSTECSAHQCCSKIPSIMAVSKRQLGPLPDLQFFVSSSCKPYIPTNGSCVNVISVNGDCGCAPDHICKYFPELNGPFLHPGKRDFFPGNPLAFRCVPKAA
ncbi:hypothetical protein KP79_PYT12561 [Mizuhopecten yessoensis]|uniref:Prokineticin domain-containing protein n=2 Tax=Mizuhopecten yessoensis TaxID=6573 RepID=A0A210QEC4_MIZYE|nr:hypothetical protein KP79_PYT12561 [Mizuhopecten yessoensis]